ncbi:hypothetical protein QJ856_gp0880 [Tupanvirus deep ocean]|uniref:Uncharacterized protein n=2 Tax=Tupanvirus TaxID=2094720 RepID=A0AC62A7Y7_9VIRU|nr:hypothetical protein QJ856_gp0880 [Tupanvirus deep ocean]QKU33876.1 hypothetical protein [Tupanvirus deep ocean]
MEIKQTFLDVAGNVYVVSSNGLLYLYESEVNQFIPFLGLMKDIKNCFSIGNRFFVYHENTISIFNEYLHNIELSENTWITKNIDNVCYNSELNVIITLEHGEVYVNLNITDMGIIEDDEIKRISLSHILKQKYKQKEIYTVYNKYDDIKVVNNVLLTFKNNKVGIFFLRIDGISFYTTVALDKQHFDQIFEFNEYYEFFNLKNTSKFLLDSRTLIHSPNMENIIYYTQRAYFWILDDHLLCLYDENEYQNIVEPLIKLLPSTENTTLEISPHQFIINILIPKEMSVSIICNQLLQLILINNQPYLVNKTLQKILLDEELISYDTINTLYPEKIDTSLVIDVEENCSIVDQLINIIPNIYRLNNEMEYQFHKIDSRGNIISYGDGVTRDVFNSLRMEIDEIFKNNLQLLGEKSAFNLGKLMYFCNRDGMETFFNIHPYFFYLLSKDSDHITLLKKFKGDSFDSYYNQYQTYKNDLSKLRDLDLDLDSIDQYVSYIMAGNLTDTQKILYKHIVNGFNYFASRNKYYGFIKNLPVMYYIKELVSSGYFDAMFEFSVKNNLVDKKTFDNFTVTFKNIFNNLTLDEKAKFCQNVTGSQYYTGTIHIVLAYVKRELNVRQAVYDENIIIDDEDIIEPVVMNDVIINLDNSESNVNSLTYQISTCNTELTINVNPTEENIREIINTLIIEDKVMKN